jgi:hypothetical protein
MLHYADLFNFRHVQFDQPFGSLDYLAALQHCVKQGASVVIVDSMSHEHEGPGGMLDMHDQELDRLAGSDWAKRERVKMLAWQKPKAARRTLINGLLQLNANFIFCFRAKQSVRPMKVGGKTEVVPQGFMPIAGDEFVFEMTVNCLLLPAARGIPTWNPENVGERQMVKPAEQFKHIFAEPRPLDEDIGRALAEWARGGSSSPRPPSSSDAATAPPDSSASSESGGDRIAQLDHALAEAAKVGTNALLEEWRSIAPADQKKLKAALDRVHKVAAVAADKASNETLL